MKNFRLNFGTIALRGVVGSERNFRGFGILPNKQNAEHFTGTAIRSLCLLRNYKHRFQRKGREMNGLETNYEKWTYRGEKSAFL